MKKGAILVNILLFVFTNISSTEIQTDKKQIESIHEFYSKTHGSQSSDQDSSLLVLEESEEETESRVRMYPLQFISINNETTISVLVGKTSSHRSLLIESYIQNLPLSLRAPPVKIDSIA